MSAAWTEANRRLVAKSIGELTYEQVLSPTHEGGRQYRLDLASGVTYRFQAWRTIWDWLRVDPASLLRCEETGPAYSVECAGQFFIDAQAALGMNDLTLGNYLEEMQGTLYADARLLEHPPTARQMRDWDGNRIQCHLHGHPKILLNKGRLGWAASDHTRYAPESEVDFPLFWIAVEETLVRTSADYAAQVAHLCPTTPPAGYIALPTHPWQWENVLRLQYAAEIAHGRIRPLGAQGDFYQPQISLRTLSNTTRPQQPDVKLPLSVLNTSAVRGINPRGLETAPALAQAVASRCQADAFLQAAHTGVLQDLATAAVEHPLYAQLDQAPYRYRETLGAVLRQSVHSQLQPGERGILTASLAHQDAQGKSLVGEYTAASGLTVDAWLELYFQRVVLPLYHLQVRHGIGLVAHGQNTVLVLRDFRPHRLLLKDFQGDLRLSRDAHLSPELAQSTAERLPARHLLHDLITGHFVSVLRFLSATLQESDAYPESRFYALLTATIHQYLATHGPACPDHDLLTPQTERVLLNPVRFALGYGDSTERPRVRLGTPLNNPLYPEASHA